MNSEHQSDSVNSEFSLQKKKPLNKRLKNLWKQHVNGEKRMVATKVQKSMGNNFRSQEKGVLGKRVSGESSVTPKETKNTQGYWAQQYIWYSERHSQERSILLQKPPSKSPFLGS